MKRIITSATRSSGSSSLGGMTVCRPSQVESHGCQVSSRMVHLSCPSSPPLPFILSLPSPTFFPALPFPPLRSFLPCFPGSPSSFSDFLKLTVMLFVSDLTCTSRKMSHSQEERHRFPRHPSHQIQSAPPPPLPLLTLCRIELLPPLRADQIQRNSVTTCSLPPSPPRPLCPASLLLPLIMAILLGHPPCSPTHAIFHLLPYPWATFTSPGFLLPFASFFHQLISRPATDSSTSRRSWQSL